MREQEPPVWVVSPPKPEPAPPEDRPPRAPDVYTLQNGGLELTASTIFFEPSLRRVSFSGSGVPRDGTQRIQFRHTGTELGLDSPLMWGGELSVHYLRRYFAVGMSAFFAGHPGGADLTPSPANTVVASQVNSSALVGYGGTLDLAGAIPAGPIAFRPGVVAGLRGFQMPMTGFEKKTCHGKRGDYPCDEQASTNALPFLEARMRVEITPNRKSGIFFGGYVGKQLIDGAGLTTGCFLGWHTPHEVLAP